MKTSIALIGVAALSAGCAAKQPPAPTPYVPAALINPRPKPIEIPADPMVALPSDIREAIRSGQPRDLHEGITTLLPYSPHTQPNINCEVLRVTEIVLSVDESAKPDGVGIGDSERWDIK